jgi:hypothetical protein
MQLTRKANLNGNDEWAKNLGDQVDALARKVPIAKEKIQELGISLAKSRIGGQTMIDTLGAVSGATAAAGDDLGNKLKGMVERGAMTKRFQLSPQELLGMDLDFGDVAKAYAEGMHVSVEEARRALVEGRVRLADGASALKRAVDEKFGAINADKLLGLDNQLQKFKADLASLAKDVDLTPVLKSIKSIADNFDATSTNGKALRNIVTTIGKAIGVTFQSGTPVVQDFIDKAVYGALKIENYWLRAKIAFASVFGPDVQLEWIAFKASVTAIAGTFIGLVETIVPGAAAIGAVVDVAKLAVFWFDSMKASVVFLKDAFLTIDWSGIGGSIIDGLVGGITSGAKRVVGAVTDLAGSVKKAFTGALDIQSPSKVMFAYGKHTAEGAELGIEEGTPAVHAAAKAMAPISDPGMGSGGSGGGGGRGPVSVVFSPQITLQAGGGDARAQLRDPSLLQALHEQFMASLRAAGIEVAA